MALKKQKWPALRIAFTAVIMLLAGMSWSQVLTYDIPGDRYLALIEEQYQQAHYALAAQSAKQYLAASAHKVYAEKATDIDKAKYYLTLSGLKTNEPGCTDAAAAMMKATSNPVYYQRIAFTLAQYYFKHNQLAKAISLYETAGVNNLNNAEIVDEKFEMAYCYFNDKKFSKAEPLLVAIKELKEGKYYMAGNYYYGLLAYNENKYKEALQSFNRIRDAKEYRNIVPYYIAEIYYFMGNREGAFKLADSLIKRRDKSYYDNDLHLLAAQCLFENQRYSDAKPYFQYYYDHKDKIRKEDLYKMAYCDYRTNDWLSAIEKFKLLSNANDSLGQTSMYLLGDCYLKTSDKQSARNAFGISADMTYNQGQQEASMILYARISYETGYDDDALRQLNTLITTFPATQYKDEANTLLSGLLVKTNNYKDALKYLDVVSRKDEGYRQIYQKATFGFAVQQFRKGDMNSAYDYFTRSLEHPENEDYENAAWFWKGELAYHLHHYNDVIVFSQNFISRIGNKEDIGDISPLATVQHAYLNMGYAAMETQNYTAAQLYFNHAQQAKGKDVYSGTVAALKEADAVFMQRNYAHAVVLYDKIIASDDANADYARYQKCILLGLLGKNNDKIALLLSIIRSIPPSAYANHARYELAITYLETDKYAQALTYLQQLTDSVSDKSFAPGAW
ncbi:MAG: tetratricopeptide repeat protein, partial [Chitinophagales bacterium]